MLSFIIVTTKVPLINPLPHLHLLERVSLSTWEESASSLLWPVAYINIRHLAKLHFISPWANSQLIGKLPKGQFPALVPTCYPWIWVLYSPPPFPAEFHGFHGMSMDKFWNFWGMHFGWHALPNSNFLSMDIPHGFRMDSVMVPTFGGNSMESIHGICNPCPQESTEFHGVCPWMFQ